MKKSMMIMGMCLFCISSVHASGMRFNSPPKTSKSPPKHAPVNAPAPMQKPQPVQVRSASPPQPLSPQPMPAGSNIGARLVSPDPDKLSFTLAVSYRGGYFGPTDLTIAQDGVYTTPSPKNPQKNFVTADLSWSNGVGISLVCNTGSGHTIRLFYDYLTNKSNNTPTFVMPTTYTNAASTLSLGGTSTGVAGQITAASGQYQLNGNNTLVLEELHLLYSTPSLKVYGSYGGLAGYLEHTALYTLTEYILGNHSQNTQQEKIVHGGPTALLLVTKHFGNEVACYGSMRFTAHAANVQHTSVTESLTGTTNNGYNVNSAGSLNRLFNEEEVSLGISWNHSFTKALLLTLTADWSGGFTGEMSTLFSSTSGTQAIRSQGLIYGLLRGTVNFTF